MLIYKFGIPLLLSLSLLKGICFQSAAQAAPAQISVDQSLYTVKRTEPLNRENLTRDYLQAKNLYNNVTQRLQLSLDRWRDAPLGRAEIDQIIAQLALINTEFLLNSQDLEAASKDLDLALARLRNAQVSMMISRPVEMRGILMDAGSIPKTREGIAQVLEQFQAAGFNTIYPEVFRRGYAIYPNSKYTDQDPELRELGFDPLWELVRESQKRNLRVIPWVWTFRVRSPGFGNPILDRVPALAAHPSDMDDTKAVPRFLSVAHPESRDYIFNLFQEMLSRYPVQGILLDYIRYDEAIPEDAISATRFRQEYFKKHGEFPPLKIAKGTPLFQEWQLWREEQVNQAVRRFKEKLRGYRQEKVLLGGSVFRSESYSRLTKMQNWRHWSNNNWIDFASDMLYTPDKKDLNLWLDWETDGGKRQDLLYPVLGAHRFSSPDDIFGQIGVIQDRHTGGLSIFALAHFKRESLKELKEGPFRKPALVPHEDLLLALKTILEDLGQWLFRVSQETEAPNPEALNGFRNQLLGLKAAYDRLPVKSYTLEQLQTPFQALLQDLNKAALPKPFKQEIRDRLGLLEKLLAIRSRQENNAAKGYTPSTQPSVVVIPSARVLPSAKVTKTDNAPILDGRIEPGEWQNATELKIKYWYNGFSESGINTSVWLSYDQDNLYIGIDNEEPYLDRMTAGAQDWDDKRLFTADDAVEIMLAPGGQKEKYYHFALNSKNVRYDARQGDQSWNGKWKSAVAFQDERWQVEIAIPLRELGIDPGKGVALAANFFRNRFQDLTPYSAWSVPFDNYHTPSRFGTLTLD
ncbi:MAG: family 10 glycosylhydrolase [Candidatus Sericytochromatia bacterium]